MNGSQGKAMESPKHVQDARGMIMKTNHSLRFVCNAWKHHQTKRKGIEFILAQCQAQNGKSYSTWEETPFKTPPKLVPPAMATLGLGIDVLKVD